MFFSKNKSLCQWIEKNNNLKELLKDTTPELLLDDLNTIAKYCINCFDVDYKEYKYSLVEVCFSYNDVSKFDNRNGYPCYIIFNLRAIKGNRLLPQYKLYLAFKTDNLKEVYNSIIKDKFRNNTAWNNLIKILVQDNFNDKFNDFFNALLTKMYLLSNIATIFDTKGHIKDFCDKLDKVIKKNILDFNLDPDYKSIILIDEKKEFNVKHFIDLAKLTINGELITPCSIYNDIRKNKDE